MLSLVIVGFALGATAVTGAPPYNWNDVLYPQFHVRPEKNWINDPNGPSYDPVHGRYHLWMQYNPFSSIWGNMSWYHTTSTDLVYFERIGVSLYNDLPYDVGGVFSGSLTFVEGNPVISYTCVNATLAQKQCSAVPVDRGDPKLTKWRKVAGNPVIESGPAPQNGVTNFRDPTPAWKLPNGTYRQAFGTSVLPNKAAIAIYDSPTMVSNYTFAGLLYTATDALSRMFECPNYYPVSDFSPAVGGQRYVLKESDESVRQDFFFVGLNSDPGKPQRFDVTCYEGVATCPTVPGPGEANARLVDFGRWYASTTFWDAKNSRRVLYGWIDEDDADFFERSWAGAQSIPRVLSYDAVSRQIVTPPIPEVMQLRRGSTSNGVWRPGNPVVLSANRAVPLYLTAVTDGLNSNASLDARRAPMMELSANFTVAAALVDQAETIKIGFDVMADGADIVRRGKTAIPRSTFVGVSLDRTRTSLPGYDMPQGEYFVGTAQGATRKEREDNCGSTCSADQRCIAWVFDDVTRNCHLKSKFTQNAPTAAASTKTFGQPAKPMFGVDRSDSGTQGSTLPHVGRADLKKSGAVYMVEFRIFVDRSVLEAFKDGGFERVASRVYNTNAVASASPAYRITGLSAQQLAAAGNVTLVGFEAYNVGNIWERPQPVLNPPSGTAAVLITALVVAAMLAPMSFLAVRQYRAERAARFEPKTAPTAYTKLDY